MQCNEMWKRGKDTDTNRSAAPANIIQLPYRVRLAACQE